jgi:FkbH-like protein
MTAPAGTLLGARIKLIVWDLDDTLWRGTLAEGDAVALFAHRADLVRAFNAAGIVSSLCSKNDAARAEARLRDMDLWDQFVFPRIAFAPKGEAVRQIVEAMHLRPVNVLFVDDNPANLGEVRHALPGIYTLDAAAGDADAMLDALLAAQPPGGRSRLDEYRMLETRARDRAAGDCSEEAFLHACGLVACAPFLMDNLDFVPRIAELVNRANQLNYTASRVEAQALVAAVIDVVAHDTWSIFARDRYGDHGLVGFVMVDRRQRRLVHFVFSCRVMHMGLERFALGKVRAKWPDCDVAPLQGRVPDEPAPWIAEESFHAAEVRERLRAATGGEGRDIRVMFDCQSGGIAHFSRHRARLDFDNAPRLFALRHMIPGAVEREGADPPWFAPLSIYGAGADYSDPRWDGVRHLLADGGLIAACADAMIEAVERARGRLLVILPPEDAPEALYRPHLGHTRARTVLFNRQWRDLAHRRDAIDVLELTGLATPADMPDVSHYYAGFLRRLAGRVDDWIDCCPGA